MCVVLMSSGHTTFIMLSLSVSCDLAGIVKRASDVNFSPEVVSHLATVNLDTLFFSHTVFHLLYNREAFNF